MTTLAKVTSKGQTTIPKVVREALKVGPGDLLAWEVAEDGGVTVRRVEALDMAWLRALEGTLDEWQSAADDEAYRDL